MSNTIAGKWSFVEEFECGNDKGFAILTQEGRRITGYLEYEECVEDEPPFFVRQYVEGTITRNHIHLEGVRACDAHGNPMDDYNLDTLEGTYTLEGKIVGHSFDSEDVCGVFVMVRIA
jgi:hypothetical protein